VGFARRLHDLGELGPSSVDPVLAVVDPIREAIPLGYEAGMLPSTSSPPRPATTGRRASGPGECSSSPVTN
jgi:hypothetical protein